MKTALVEDFAKVSALLNSLEERYGRISDRFNDVKRSRYLGRPVK